MYKLILISLVVGSAFNSIAATSLQVPGDAIIKSPQFLMDDNKNKEQKEAVETEQSSKNIPLIFDKVWARTTMSQASNSAVYLTIRNPTNRSYHLIGASSLEIANNVELHQTFVDNDNVSRMVHIDKIAIPPNEKIELAPNGMHIMLFDVKKTLREGTKFKLNLIFEELGQHTIEVEARSKGF